MITTSSNKPRFKLKSKIIGTAIGRCRPVYKVSVQSTLEITENKPENGKKRKRLKKRKVRKREVKTPQFSFEFSTPRFPTKIPLILDNYRYLYRIKAYLKIINSNTEHYFGEDIVSGVFSLSQRVKDSQ